MSPKKQYQKKLPAILPPTQRRPPAEGPAAAPSAGKKAAPPSPSRPPQVMQSPQALRAPRTPAPRRGETDVASPKARRSTTPPAAPPHVTEPPAVAPTTSRTRAAIAGGILLGLLVVAFGLWWTTRGEPEDRPSATPTVGSWPPPGSSRTVTQVRADGTLEVTHWITSDEPLDEVELALPGNGSSRSTDTGPVTASGVEVVADGEPASGPSVPTFRRTAYLFPDATRIRVRYELTGGVELSSSAPGRGLVTTSSLAVSPTQARETRIVMSEAVLSMACATSSAPDSSNVPCGQSDSTGQWTVQLTGENVGRRIVAAVTVGP